jgi:hypothetical protein
MKNDKVVRCKVCRRGFLTGVLIVMCTWNANAQLMTTPDKAITTSEGVLRKVWFIKANTPLHSDLAKSTTLGVFPQNAKAYLYGQVGDGLMAVGNRPRKEDCVPAEGGFFGYVPADSVMLWDTDQALRFTGESAEITVAVFADPELQDKVADFSVAPTTDPTVEPFPIFRRTPDGRAFEIASVLAAEGKQRSQQSLKMDPQSIAAMSSIDIAFVMDVTGSMGEELADVKERLADLMRQFARETINVQDRQEPLRLRFAFVGFRDIDADGDRWIEKVDFINIGMEADFRTYLAPFKAQGGGDEPESVFLALNETIETLGWNPANAKAIVLIGDAPAKDIQMMDEVVELCGREFVTVYAIAVGPHQIMRTEFRTLASRTEGIMFAFDEMDSSNMTVSKIVDAVKTMHVRSGSKVSDVVRHVEAGSPVSNITAQLSRTIQEFKKRGIMPKWGERPLPSTVFVPSSESQNMQVCIYKSKAQLHDMLGQMQMDFIGMARDANPETLLALQSGGLEMLAELAPDTLNAIIDMKNLAEAPARVQELLRAMPGLPDLLKKISETNPADVAEWRNLAERTAGLSRFVADPKNFFRDHAWVPFEVMSVK